MRIIICDDDSLITSKLNNIINNYFLINSLKSPTISIYNNGEDLLADSEDKDIVFLDIEMPGLNGIYVGNELIKKYPRIIIFVITSYAKYLDDAMRFHVFRYLSKPLDEKRICRNMDDALNLYNNVSSKIAIETKTGVYTIPISDIILIEVNLHKVTIHTIKCDYLSIHSFHYWLEKLHLPCFFSPHRSYIVNLDYVCDFDHSLIHLYNSRFTAYLTKRKYSQFKDAYLLYLESTR